MTWLLKASQSASQGQWIRSDGYVFPGNAGFRKVQFSGSAGFREAQFMDNALFNNDVFVEDANFSLAKFEQFASFAKAHFQKGVHFSAIRGKRGFSAAGTVFDGGQDIIQAHFEEAPHLNNVNVKGQFVVSPDASEPDERLSRLKSWTVRSRPAATAIGA